MLDTHEKHVQRLRSDATNLSQQIEAIDELVQNEEANVLSESMSEVAAGTYGLLSANPNEMKIKYLEERIAMLESDIYEALQEHHLPFRRIYRDDLNSGDEFTLAAGLSVTYDEHNMVIVDRGTCLKVMGLPLMEIDFEFNNGRLVMNSNRFPSVGILVEDETAE